MTRTNRLTEAQIPVNLAQRLLGARQAVGRCRQSAAAPVGASEGLARAGEYVAALEKPQNAELVPSLARRLIGCIAFAKQYSRAHLPWYIAAWRAFPDDEQCAFFLAALCQAGVYNDPEISIALYANLLNSQWMDSPRWDEYGLNKRTVLSDLALLYAGNTTDLSPERILIVDATFRRALETAPERAALAAYLSVAYRTDDLTTADAEEVYACHFEAQPDDRENTRFLADFMLRGERVDDLACAVYARRAVDAERQSDGEEATRWTIALTHAYIRAGRMGEGMLTTFREAQRLAPDDMRIGAALAYIAAQQEPEQCDPDLWATLETALSCEREYVPIFAEYGWDWTAVVRSLAEGWGHGNRTDRAARGVYERATVLFPQDTRFLVFQARSLASVRNYSPQTLPIYRQAHLLDPEQEEIALALGRAYISAGAHLSAEEQQAAMVSDAAAGVVRRVAMAARENRNEEDDADEVPAEDGLEASRGGDTEAAPSLADLLALPIRDENRNSFLFDKETDAGQETNAEEEATRLRAELRRDALILWEQLFRRGRIWPELLRAITVAYTHEERVSDTGMKVLERHAAFEAGETIPLVRLAREWRARGDKETALKLFEQGVARNGNDFEALFETGLMRIEHLSDISGGSELLRRAMAAPVGPQHLQAHLTLGEVLLKQNRREEARALFQKILDDIDPDHALARQHLARLERELTPPAPPDARTRPYGRRASDGIVPPQMPPTPVAADWMMPFPAPAGPQGNWRAGSLAEEAVVANDNPAQIHPANGQEVATFSNAPVQASTVPLPPQYDGGVDAPAPLWPTLALRASAPAPVSPVVASEHGDNIAPVARRTSTTAKRKPAASKTTARARTTAQIAKPEPVPAAEPLPVSPRASEGETNASCSTDVVVPGTPISSKVPPSSSDSSGTARAVAQAPAVWDVPNIAPDSTGVPQAPAAFIESAASQRGETAALEAHIAQHGPDAVRCRQLADLYIAAGEFERAESTLRQIITLGQADKRLYTLLGEVMLRVRSGT